VINTKALDFLRTLSTVSILSVCGPKRTGKSFFCNMFLPSIPSPLLSPSLSPSPHPSISNLISSSLPTSSPPSILSFSYTFLSPSPLLNLYFCIYFSFFYIGDSKETFATTTTTTEGTKKELWIYSAPLRAENANVTSYIVIDSPGFDPSDS
jgi:hypothetical protein